MKRPTQLAFLTYPELYRWWRSATPAEQKRATSKAANGQVLVSKSKGANDLHDYEIAKSILDTATESLAELLTDHESLVQTGEQLVALSRCLKEHVSHQLSKLLKTFTLKKRSLVRSMNVTLTQQLLLVRE